MRKFLIAVSCVLLAAALAAADEKASPGFGFHVIAGGRYDDVRMCVGSPAGFKGGPIMDVYFDVVLPVSDSVSVVFNLPVMRPVLFGAAFKMLQFEPQMTVEYTSGDSGLVFGGGLGGVFHYGPDYKSSLDDRSPDFFAAGPLVSASVGKPIAAKKGYWMPGIKVFYSPLFSADVDFGQVLGASLELHYRFGK